VSDGLSSFAKMGSGYYTDKFSNPVFWPIAGGVCFGYFVGLAMIHRIINFKY